MHPANFRDVGDVLGLWLDASPIPAGHLFRGGRLDDLSRLDEIGRPRTVLNLRSGPDPSHLGIAVLHVPAPNHLENYDTASHGVRRWLGDALRVLAAPQTTWPVYVHCTSGRDRTGVVVAAALLAIGVPRDIVIEEYLLSDGASLALITRALDGLASFALAAGDLAALRQRLGQGGA